MPARIYRLPLAPPHSAPESDSTASTIEQTPDPSSVIDLHAHRSTKRLEEAVRALQQRLTSAEIPSPEALGWIPVDQVDGRAVKWHQPQYGAFIGYVPGSPDLVYLDRNHRCCCWSMSLEELALGLETGTLREPLHELQL